MWGITPYGGPAVSHCCCRAKLDPDNILGNKLLDTLLGTPGQPSAVKA
jgi:hypothetical protein